MARKQPVNEGMSRAENWERIKDRYIAWWEHRGLMLFLTAPKSKSSEGPSQPPRAPADLEQKWTDPSYRVNAAQFAMEQTFYCADAIPVMSPAVGAGDIAAFLGCKWRFGDSTVWYEPCIADINDYPPLRIIQNCESLRALIEITKLACEEKDGRYLVGMPDLVENVDILSALRGPENLMFDLIENPKSIEPRLFEINQAFYEAFELFCELIRDDDGSNAFGPFELWGPGRTAKVQADCSALFSPDMFRRFVVPALTEQCRWLDYAMFHLDGEDCIRHLDLLLDINELQAIEWTPVQVSLGKGGGEPEWYELYRRILKGGKSVQAIAVGEDQVIPLLDAVGPDGMFVQVRCTSETAALELSERVDAYR
jgi:hypothetical protein